MAPPLTALGVYCGLFLSQAIKPPSLIGAYVELSKVKGMTVGAVRNLKTIVNAL